MKKSIKLFITIFTIILLSTGCMKYESSMTINDDFSIKYSTIVGYNKNDFERLVYLHVEDESAKDQFKLTQEQIKSFKTAGITAEEYEDNDLIGVSLYKSFDSINDLSTDVDTSCEMDLIDKNIENQYCFKRTKGFFFDTYSAKISTKPILTHMYVEDDYPTEEEFIEQNNINVDEYDITYDPETQTNVYRSNDGTKEYRYEYRDKEREDVSDIPAYMMENASFKFILSSKYKIANNNATVESDDGKRLEWDFLDQRNHVDYIEFDVRKPNYLSIGVGIIAGIVVVLLIFGLIFSSINKFKENQKIKKEEAEKEKLAALNVQQVEELPENSMINSLLAPDTTTQQVTQDEDTSFIEEDDEPIQSDIYE